MEEATFVECSSSVRRDGVEDDRESEKEEKVLSFLDSLDAYISLIDSLSSTLQKGWLELASARHSMGPSRISSALFDLKVQSAPTTVQVSDSVKGPEQESQYTLSKWGSSKDEHFGDLTKSINSQLRHRGSPHISEESEETAELASGSSTTVDTNIRRERSRSLAVFGTLVSPKLRSTQVTFETALETLVEIANMRSSMLSAYSQIRKENMACNEGVID